MLFLGINVFDKTGDTFEYCISGLAEQYYSSE